MSNTVAELPKINVETPSKSVSLLGPYVLAAALVLGILGDALLVVSPWGINVLLWTAVLALLVFALARQQRIPLTGGGRWLVLPMLLFAALVAVRDSPTLTVCNILALLLVLALAAPRLRVGRLRIAGILDYATDPFIALVFSVLGGIMLLVETPWTRFSFPGWSKQARAVGCGVLLAVPFLFLFGILFASADPIFGGLAAGLFNWNVGDFTGHLFWIGAWGWLTAGLLYQTFIAGGARVDATRPGNFGLGIVEVGVALGLLNVLFLTFVLVQFRYFFGGAATLDVSPGLTYADYARRGFFELVAVAALVLPVLLLAHWMARLDNPRQVRIFNALAATLIALLFVIMVSAVQRMRLYTEEYGLTELRLYTTAFMGWLALVFIWFLWTVLRGRRERFVFGALAAGLLVLAGLNAFNPDELIVRTNVGRISLVRSVPSSSPFDRVGSERPFDASYVAGLSADAVPPLVQALPLLTAQDRCLLSKQILARWTPPARVDWRAWNMSRALAWQTVATNLSNLSEGCIK